MTVSEPGISPTVWSGGPEPELARQLWSALTNRLSCWRPDWEDAITAEKAPQAPTAYRFAQMSEEAVFKAFAIAAISGNTRWDRIASIEHDLDHPFQGFSPGRFAALPDREISEHIVPWFRQRRAGSARLPSVLSRLKDTARILGCDEARTSTAFLSEVLLEAHHSPEQAAVLIGTPSTYKLPGFGIALAAEALRLLGLDVCKPDRHVLRAIASWRIVRFNKWPEGQFAAPDARPEESLATMLAVRRIATMNAVSVSYATSVIWLAGAVSGARLSNEDLARIWLPA